MTAVATFEQRLAASPATPHQRLYIRCMLQQLEFDLTHIGDDAQGVWRDAGLPEPPSGMRLDAVLAAIRRVDANRLIGALKMRVEPRS